MPRCWWYNINNPLIPTNHPHIANVNINTNISNNNDQKQISQPPPIINLTTFGEKELLVLPKGFTNWRATMALEAEQIIIFSKYEKPKNSSKYCFNMQLDYCQCYNFSLASHCIGKVRNSILSVHLFWKHLGFILIQNIFVCIVECVNDLMKCWAHVW